MINNIDLSEEQKKYVFSEFDVSRDTLLQACAGSGKTRCILERMRYLAYTGALTKD